MSLINAIPLLDEIASEIEKQNSVIALAIDRVSDDIEKLSKYELRPPIRSINDFYTRCKDNEPLLTFAYDFAADHGYSKIPLAQRVKAIELDNLWKWYDHDMAGFDNEDELVDALNTSAKTYKFPESLSAKYIKEKGHGTPGKSGYKPSLWYWITPEGKKKLIDQK